MEIQHAISDSELATSKFPMLTDTDSEDSCAEARSAMPLEKQVSGGHIDRWPPIMCEFAPRDLWARKIAQLIPHSRSPEQKNLLQNKQT